MQADRPEDCLLGISHSLRFSEIGTKRRCRVLALFASTVIKPRSRSISFQSSLCNSAVRRPAKAPKARKGRRVLSAFASNEAIFFRYEDGDRGFRLLVPHHRGKGTFTLDQITAAPQPNCHTPRG